MMELPPCHTHHFRLVGNINVDTNRNNNGIELYIREMAMAPPVTASNADDETPATNTTISKTENFNDLINILGGTVPMNDTTGYGIWSASIIMGQWMTDVFYNSTNTLPNEAPIQTILELGAGCGIPGITVAKSFVSRHEQSELPKVYVTDLNHLTLQNLQHNVNINHVDSIASVVSLDWNELTNSEDDKVWPWMVKSTKMDVSSEEELQGIDVLIGSDLVYQKEVVPILLQTIRKLRPKKFFYGAAGTNRDGHDLFIESLQDGQMTLVSSFPAPRIYRTTNPLYNQDDDECFIHFQDLLLLPTENGNGSNGYGDDTFILYEFIAIEN
jgi:Lysine methyltransferase